MSGVVRINGIRAVGMIVFAGFAAGCAGTPAPDPTLHAPSPATSWRVVPHAAWEAHPPLGQEAEAVRRNLAPGDSLQFQDLTLMVREMRPGDAADEVDVGLEGGGASERRSVQEGAAFNWRGYHVAVLAVRTGGNELGGGLAEFEVATLASMPRWIADSDSAGGAAFRLRIPHDIHSITLHHSGSAEPLRPDDDPTRELRGLQTWGADARNWWDVPYHYLIDLDGTVYQGRAPQYAGETNTAYDPRGHLLISVLGNYDRQEPTPAQIEAIVDIMAGASLRYGVPAERIYGHRDHAATSCPGEHLWRYLEDGTLQDRVNARLGRD